MLNKNYYTILKKFEFKYNINNLYNITDIQSFPSMKYLLGQ